MLVLPMVVVTVRRAQRKGAWDLCPLNGHLPGHPQPSTRARVIATTWGLRRGQAYTTSATVPTIEHGVRGP